VRRGHFAAIGPDIRETHVIDEDEDDVGAVVGGGFGAFSGWLAGEKGEAEEEEGERSHRVILGMVTKIERMRERWYFGWG